jgi:O-antigen ligase
MRAAKTISVPIIVFLFALLAGLNVYFDPRAMDMTLVPRLQALYWMLGAGLVTAAMWMREWPVRNLRDPLVVLSGAYAVACGLSLFSAYNPAAGLLDFFRATAAFLVLCLLCIFVPALPDGRRWLLRAVVCAALISTTIGILQIALRVGARIPTRFRLNKEGVEGFMSNINAYAILLSLLLPLCLCAAVGLRRAWRWLAVCACIMTAGMILVVQSRSAYVGLAAGVLVATVLAACRHSALGLKKEILWGLISLLAAVTVVGLMAVFSDLFEANRYLRRLAGLNPMDPDASISGRMVIWEVAWRMIKDHPLFGVGAGNFTIRIDEYFAPNYAAIQAAGTNWIQPHNDFLWVFAEKGAIGLIPFVGLFAVAAWKVFKLSGSNEKEEVWMAVFLGMGLVAYFISSLFDSPLDRINSQVYFACYLSLLVLGSAYTTEKGVRAAGVATSGSGLGAMGERRHKVLQRREQLWFDYEAGALEPGRTC